MTTPRTYLSLVASALRWLAIVALFALGACVQDMDPSPGNDASASSDGGAATTDAAAALDAAPSDALGPPDANPCDYDAGVADGGAYDGGPRDAGPCDRDAGMPIYDAGLVDALL